MRKLKTPDVFGAVRIITKSSLRERLFPILKRIAESGDLDVTNVGIDGILTVLEVISEESCEQAVYKWLAGPFEMEPDDVAMLELTEMAEKLTQLKEDNDLQYFFTVLYKLISKKR